MGSRLLFFECDFVQNPVDLRCIQDVMALWSVHSARETRKQEKEGPALSPELYSVLRTPYIR